MNPLTNVKNIERLSRLELEKGIPLEKSWHRQYKDSAWIFIGGLNYELTEGDVICVFSQYGEVENINLIRDHKTGKSKGFGFLCYEDQRSTILAVDNLNGIKLSSKIIRVDHVEEYKVPKMKEGLDPEKQRLFLEGCGPSFLPVKEDVKIVKAEAVKEISEESNSNWHKKKKEKKKRERSRSSSSSSSSHKGKKHKRKKEKRSK